MPKIFELENHTYCSRRLRDNFLGRAPKLGIRKHASKDLLKKMFNRVACTLTGAQYEVVLCELKHYKGEVACWV